VTQPRDVSPAVVRADLLRAIQSCARAITTTSQADPEAVAHAAKAARNLAEAYALLGDPP
jgi:hypothetical protein